MVINVGQLKAKNYDYVLNEIKEIKAACGDKILKVIIETCLLTEDEKIKMCEIVTESGADYIKTSTGFSTAGATFDDIALFARCQDQGCRWYLIYRGCREVYRAWSQQTWNKPYRKDS